MPSPAPVLTERDDAVEPVVARRDAVEHRLDRAALFVALGQARVSNLHTFCDAAGGAFGFEGPKRPLNQAGKERILALAQEVMKENPAESLPDANDTDPHDWVMESYRLARDVTYKNITEGGAPSQSYTEEAQKLSRKRLALAGYRLAGVLNKLFVAEAPKPSPTPANK